MPLSCNFRLRMQIICPTIVPRKTAVLHLNVILYVFLTPLTLLGRNASCGALGGHLVNQTRDH